ncbi:MAG: low molecular weight phosphotyrosine protein phosphatase [Acidimicrobiaceae bacterium]|nr:low molecular weight phosphotyrosine protein phosphatase [Acidimicrobiaceae bacterium]MBP9053447.1 low molecular weight phosphotyrosine protein phosphatase [Ilumatobacteraceae bacterium]
MSVLFVCLGNHCRSPAAHAVANSMRRNDPFLRFDSAGTGNAHVGNAPHPLAVAEGAQRGYRVDHLGRQIHPDDFVRFDLIVAMDRMNVDDLERMRGGVEQRIGYYPTVEPLQVQLLRRWDPYAMPGDEDLVDPWGQPPAAYGEMFDVIERSVPPLLAHLAWLRADRPIV